MARKKMTKDEAIAVCLDKFRYDAETGDLYDIKTGKKKACVVKRGYYYIHVGDKQLRAHRIAWMIAKGDIPSGMVIDHINGIRTDNRLVNLRLIDTKSNSQNMVKRMRKHNLPCGVTIKKGKFRARVKVNSKHIVVGNYATEYEAGLAYIQAKLKYHPHADVSRLIAELAKWASQNK